MHFRPKSLKELAQKAPTLEAWGLGLAEFLDEVNVVRKSGHKQLLLHLIHDEPPTLKGRFDNGETADAFGAALAEYIAQSVAASAPSWTSKRDRFLAEAWFPLPHIASHPRLRSLIERETPPSFRDHNVFIDENSLVRV